PSDACHIARFEPTMAPETLPWDTMRSCAARTRSGVFAGPVLADPGMICPSASWSWGDGPDASGVRPARALPCVLRSPSGSGRAFDLTCDPPGRPAPHPEAGETETAAFRCVLPEAALATFDETGRRPITITPPAR
ncbi:MAG: hypothetical protein WCJ30_29715, partial [Deltaproteobacteria bacterium]